jgi:hypothetical protein
MPEKGTKMALSNSAQELGMGHPEERKELARMMIQEGGVDVVAKRVLWVKARQD